MGEKRSSGIVQGTLDMLILKALALEPMHAYGIGLRLQQISGGARQVNAGSLFPAFRRLEREDWIRGKWRTAENNRRAKYYAITNSGRKQLEAEAREWQAQAAAIFRVLQADAGEL
jgi:transcriptional regulator